MENINALSTTPASQIEITANSSKQMVDMTLGYMRLGEMVINSNIPYEFE